MSSVKGVSHLSRRAKRRLYCKLQLWMWRKRREKCYFGTFRTRRRPYRFGSGSCLSLKTQSQKTKRKCPTSVLPSHGCDTIASKKRPREQSSLLQPRETDEVSEMFVASSSLQNHIMDTNIAAATTSQTSTVQSQQTDTCETTDGFKLSQTVTDSDVCGTITQPKAPAGSLEIDTPSGRNAGVSLDPASNTDTDEGITRTQFSLTDVSHSALTKDILGIYALIFVFFGLHFAFMLIFVILSCFSRVP